MTCIYGYRLASAGFFVGENAMMTMSEFVCFVLPCGLGGFCLGLIFGGMGK